MTKYQKPRLAALIIAAAIAFISAPSSANVTIASGGVGGTYNALVENMVKVCGSTVGITNVQSGGAIDNMQKILDNQVMTGIVQYDVLRYYDEKDDGTRRLKVLFPLHVEEIHIIGLNKAYKEGGLFGFGAKSIELKSIDDLRGRKVVAWGGSVLSAEYFSQKLKINYEVIEIPAANAPTVAAQMLAAGDVQAIFAVGGQPLGWLRNDKVYGKQFKLLSIPTSLTDTVKGTYKSSKLNYPNLANDGVIVTAGVQSLLITRDYKTPERIAELVGLRSCVNDNLDNLREGTGVHPKWQTIDTREIFEGWQYYEPNAQTKTVAPKKK